MLLAWPTWCSPLETYSRLATHSNGTTHSNKHSNSQSWSSLKRSTTEWKYSTKRNLHAWLPIGQNMHGIGYWLFQKHCTCPSNDLFCCKSGWKITLVGSRITHAAKSRYAPIKRWSTGSGRCPWQSQATLNWDRSLDHIWFSNTRSKNLKENTLRHRFKMAHSRC